MPRPEWPAFETPNGDENRGWYDCPVAMTTPEHWTLFRMYGHYRANRGDLLRVMEYPNKTLRKMEIIDQEMRYIEAKTQE